MWLGQTISHTYISDWSAYSVLRSNYSKICSQRVQRKYSTIILIVIRSIRWDSSAHEPTHRSTHDHHNPNPDMRLLTKSRSWHLRWWKEKPKPTPPTSPSRDVGVIDTHVPRSRAKRPWQRRREGAHIRSTQRICTTYGATEHLQIVLA